YDRERMANSPKSEGRVRWAFRVGNGENGCRFRAGRRGSGRIHRQRHVSRTVVESPAREPGQPRTRALYFSMSRTTDSVSPSAWRTRATMVTAPEVDRHGPAALAIPVMPLGGRAMSPRATLSSWIPILQDDVETTAMTSFVLRVSAASHRGRFERHV